MSILASGDSRGEFDSGLSELGLKATAWASLQLQSGTQERSGARSEVAFNQERKTVKICEFRDQVWAGRDQVCVRATHLPMPLNFRDSAYSAKLLQTASWRPGHRLISVWW
jgi:hypothetical protein